MANIYQQVPMFYIDYEAQFLLWQIYQSRQRYLSDYKEITEVSQQKLRKIQEHYRLLEIERRKLAENQASAPAPAIPSPSREAIPKVSVELASSVVNLPQVEEIPSPIGEIKPQESVLPVEDIPPVEVVISLDPELASSISPPAGESENQILPKVSASDYVLVLRERLPLTISFTLSTKSVMALGDKMIGLVGAFPFDPGLPPLLC